MFRDIFSTISTKIASAVIALAILILTTQYLGAEGRGLVSIIYAAIMIIGIFCGFIGGPATVYLAAKKPLHYLLIPIYSWIVVIAIAGSLVVWIFDLVPIPYIVPVGIISTIASMYFVNLYILVGHQRIRTNNLIYLSQWIINFVGLFIFFTIMNEATVWYVVVALFISNLFGLIMTFFELRSHIHLKPFDMSEEMSVIQTLVSLSFFAQTATLLYFLNFRLGLFSLNSSTGLFETGIYSVGINIADFILLASQSIALVAYSRISNSTERDYSISLTVKLTKLSFLVTVAITLAMILVPPEIYSFIFGKDFSTVSGVLLTMSPGIIAFGTSIILFHYFAGIGKNWINAKAAFAGFCVNVLLCYLLIPQYGEYGAGVTASVAFLTMSFILLIVFMRETGISLREMLIRKEDIIFAVQKIKEEYPSALGNRFFEPGDRFL